MGNLEFELKDSILVDFDGIFEFGCVGRPIILGTETFGSSKPKN